MPKIVSNYNELYHWGIKGQKWGVRRYQNEDGTLTEAGKARYSNSDGSLNESGKARYRDTGRYNSNGKIYQKKRSSNMTNEELNDSNRRIASQRLYDRSTNDEQPNSSQHINKIGNGIKSINATSSDRAKRRQQERGRQYAKKVNLSKMSDKELQQAVNRMNLQNNYIRLTTPGATEAQIKAQKRRQTVNDFITYGLAIVTIAAGIKGLFSKRG